MQADAFPSGTREGEIRGFVTDVQRRGAPQTAQQTTQEREEKCQVSHRVEEHRHVLLSSDDGIRKPSGVTGLYSAFSYTAMACSPEVSRPQRSRGRRAWLPHPLGKSPQCVSLYSPYGPDHGVGHSGSAGALCRNIRF